MSELQTTVETVNFTTRKMKIIVPTERISKAYQARLAEVQKQANLKGFRPGMAPLPMVEKMYEHEIKHHLFHRLVDDTFQEALSKEKLRAVSQPQIESPQQGDKHEHDHAVSLEKNFEYSATFEVIPELDLKGYKNLKVKLDNATATTEEITQALDNTRNQFAQLSPKTGGANVTVANGDYVDLEFKGGLMGPNGVEFRAEMSGRRTLEIGSKSFITGFEEQVVGLESGGTKTFEIKFPEDYFEESYKGKQAQFTVTAHEIKTKELPALDDTLAQQAGFASLAELKAQTEKDLVEQKQETAKQKARSEIIKQIVEQNPFDVPAALIHGQARILAQEVAKDLTRQGMGEDAIRDAITQEYNMLKTRAEAQVRASLILEAIARKENIRLETADIDQEVERLATLYKTDVAKIREHFLDREQSRENFEFRLNEEKVIKFLMNQGK